MFEHIDRRQVKAESRAILQEARVSPMLFFTVYLAVTIFIELCSLLASAAGSSQSLLGNPAELFITVFSFLLTPILTAGIYFYCSAIRRGEQAELLTLFDGFSFAGKIIVLRLLEGLFIVLWSFLFIVPGLIAAYRYSFAYMNLCENPSLSPLEALNLSKLQTRGYKLQLLQLDLSYLIWAFMASLPSVLLTGLAADFEQLTAIAANPLYIAAELVFYFAFTLLYLPPLSTCRVAYYETAVRTSGASPNRYPRDKEAPFF